MHTVAGEQGGQGAGAHVIYCIIYNHYLFLTLSDRSIVDTDDYSLDNKLRKYIFQTHPGMIWESVCVIGTSLCD